MAGCNQRRMETKIRPAHGSNTGAGWLVRARRAALLCVLATVAAQAGTLTGTFTSPSGGPVVNGTLVLRLSQATVVPGTEAVVPSLATCYTDAQGAVHGVGNPTLAPVLSAAPGSGTLPPGNYFVEVTLYTPSGESLPSPEAAISLSGQGEITVTYSGAADGAGQLAVYIASASGAETRQGFMTAGQPYAQSAPLISGSLPPAANTSPCTLTFNDAMIPAPTYYTATLEDANGNTLPGYPQDWYLSGSVDDVSQIEPLAIPPGIRFAQPVVQNPATSEAQSINSPVNLNGYSLDGSSNVGPAMVNIFAPGNLPAPTAALDEWTPNAAVVVRRLSAFAQTAGSGGAVGATLALVQGSTQCTAAGLMPAATQYTSETTSGSCAFQAGVPISVEITSDDHSTRPANVEITIEETAQ